MLIFGQFLKNFNYLHCTLFTHEHNKHVDEIILCVIYISTLQARRFKLYLADLADFTFFAPYTVGR